MDTKTELPFPENLPPLPKAPDGYRAVYRGRGWKANNVRYACIAQSSLPDADWGEFSTEDFTMGDSEFHYAEAIPITEPDYTSPSYRARVEKAYKEGAELEITRPGNHYKNSWTTPSHVPFDWDRFTYRVKAKEELTPLEVLCAVVFDGKEAQFLSKGNGGELWLDCNAGNLIIMIQADYKVRLRPDPAPKPEPIKLPLRAEDIPAVCWIRHKDNSIQRLVIAVNTDRVMANRGDEITKYLFDDLLNQGWEYSPDRKTWSGCFRIEEGK